MEFINTVFVCDNCWRKKERKGTIVNATHTHTHTRQSAEKGLVCVCVFVYLSRKKREEKGRRE